jgi:hypothetical protein
MTNEHDKTQHSSKEFNFRQTGKPRFALSAVRITADNTCAREDHYTPEKFRMECVWENLLRPLTVRRHLPEFLYRSSSFPGAGEGNRTPDPLITNQMLYRLSYASNSGDKCASAQTYPSDPFQMSGTIS